MEALVVLAGEPVVTQPAPYICTMPYAPPSFNVYDRWPDWRQREEKRRWQGDLLALLNEKGNRAPRGLERVELHAVISFAVTRGRDGDNYSMPLWKWTQDALVATGVLVNDTADRCRVHQPVLEVGGEEQTVLMIVGREGA